MNTALAEAADISYLAKEDKKPIRVSWNDPDPLDIANVVEDGVEIYDPRKGRYLRPLEQAEITQRDYMKTFLGDRIEDYL